MKFFRRGPKFQDQALRELSEMFLFDRARPTPGLELLDAGAFDYSVESLRALDDYLERMRKRALSDDEMSVLVLRAGAYLGEVIRRASVGREYHWIDHEQAVRHSKLVAGLGEKDLGIVAMLWADESSITFPLGKVGKFLQNGREDSTYFYASFFAGAFKPPDRTGLGPGAWFVPSDGGPAQRIDVRSGGHEDRPGDGGV